MAVHEREISKFLGLYNTGRPSNSGLGLRSPDVERNYIFIVVFAIHVILLCTRSLVLSNSNHLCIVTIGNKVSICIHYIIMQLSQFVIMAGCRSLQYLSPCSLANKCV